MDDSNAAGTVAEFWDKNVGKHREPFAHCESPRPIADFINQYISGSDQLSPFLCAVQTYGPFYDIAELGSGDGALLQTLMPAYPESAYHAYDISAHSLEVARANCARFETTRQYYTAFDANVETLPAGAFDAVFTTGTTHHIEKLDHAFASIAQALKPRGVLIFNDYVGSARFQWPDALMRVAAELLACVPEQWRVTDAIWKNTPETVANMDPSEAVASDHIEDALLANFHIMERHVRPGTVLYPIFGTGAISPTIVDSEEGRQTLRLLAEVEMDLVNRGVVKATSFFAVCTPRRNRETLVGDLFASRKRGLRPAA